ncbi:hypothetical protein RhiXN_05826 [Rhizoctonia solani]|uniref:Uncharacterized protein n=1 Tax=Rhizoctonia solani TaxID=456999 RepID=A0A8H8NZB9_9AGAM|nr:uncharacterized protein RhiXN_05826 [Rhizoctonia solani]QRW20837.1 hypothetical protein RhiXN_05826 [Rhizoctonia solani]
MDYPAEDDDTVIWQCSQAVALKHIFKDAPVATAPPPSVSAPGSRPGVPATTSAETLGLIQQLSRTLGGSRTSNPNPARRNTRVASTGNIKLGMPPPKLKPPGSDEASTIQLWFDSIAIPSTPPNRTLSGPRSATEPTITVSALLDHARAESPELPSPPIPVKPIISIRTDAEVVNKSAFCTRINTLESAMSATGSGSFVSTAAPISPTTPLVALPPRPETPETPILDLTEISPTPSPEPRPLRKASRPKSPPIEVTSVKVSPEASRPVPDTARAITEPNTSKRPPAASLKHTQSEPSRSFKPPVQAFKPPTQTVSKPPTQTTFKSSPTIFPTQRQNSRTFSSSQARLGLGTVGRGYSQVNRPFKMPNKGKGTVPLTVVPLPRRDGVVKASASPSRKKENIDAGRGKRGNSPAPAARPSTNRPTSNLSSRTTSGSSIRTTSTRTTGKPTNLKVLLAQSAKWVPRLVR